MCKKLLFLVLILGLYDVGPAFGVSLLAPGDAIIAIDSDGLSSNSDYPTTPNYEGPPNVLDQTSGTKYLNFAKEDSGFIVTPSGMTSGIVQSMLFTTANDATERDPNAWTLYGTNDTITSLDNSTGTAENWTLINSGFVSLPDDRTTNGPVITVTNSTSYTSYKLIFTELKDSGAANSMQIADVRFYESTNGTGANVLGASDPILAVHMGPDSSYPGHEGPANAIDGTTAKYLNFGEENSGFIVTPSFGASLINRFRIATANDFPQRDPSSYELYGTNDVIVSEDNSEGTAESWTLIDSGSLSLPEERDTWGSYVSVDNANTYYTSYKMLFPTLKDASNGSMQLSEVEFDGAKAQALNVSPVNGAQDVAPTATLIWKISRDPDNLSVPDPDVVAHIIYVHTDPNMVASATLDNHAGLEYFNEQLVTWLPPPDPDQVYDPTPDLAKDSTYYWRVDERLDYASEPNLLPGAVWQFDTQVTLPQVNPDTPADVMVRPGEDAVFEVVAIDPLGGTLSYQWYRNGVPLHESDPNYTDVTESILTVVAAQVEDEGLYKCAVSNVGATVDSRSAVLLIGRLVNHYKLDSNADDSVGGYHGSLLGDPNWDPGMVDQAMHMESQEGALVVLDEYYPTSAQQITVSAWVYAETKPSWASILKNWGSSVNGMIHLGLNSSGASLDVQMAQSSGDAVTVTESGVDFPTNQWQFVTAVADGSMVRLYRNGLEVGAGDYDGTLNATHPFVGIGFKPADDGSGPDPASPGFWDGLIDDIRVYNYGLSPLEIAQLYYDVTGEGVCQTRPTHDYNIDCVVNLLDFSMFASEWLDCGLIPVEACP